MSNASEKADVSDTQGVAESVENGKERDASTPEFSEEERAIEKR